jgi:hypothetical protein
MQASKAAQHPPVKQLVTLLMQTPQLYSRTTVCTTVRRCCCCCCFMLQASSIEECCEWAIALRESIALASSTGAAAASSGSTGKSLPSRLSR